MSSRRRLVTSMMLMRRVGRVGKSRTLAVDHMFDL
jgi:hypothetical protein